MGSRTHFPNPTEYLRVFRWQREDLPQCTSDFAYAAVACGVAEIAYSGLLFTPDFGSRQRFHMIITDAVIEPTPILEKNICDDCGNADACPLQAISKTDYKTVTICGKSMKVANIDYSLCANAKMGRSQSFTFPGKPDRVAALCSRTCRHLEQEAIRNTFHNRFRQSQPWALDVDGKYVREIEV